MKKMHKKAPGRNIHWFSNGTHRAYSGSSILESYSTCFKDDDSAWAETIRSTAIPGLNMEGLLDLIEDWTSNNGTLPRALASNAHHSTNKFDTIRLGGEQNGENMSSQTLGEETNVPMSLHQGGRHLAQSGHTVDDNDEIDDTDDIDDNDDDYDDDANDDDDVDNQSVRHGRSPEPTVLAQKRFTHSVVKPIRKRIRRPKFRQSLSSEPESDSSMEICTGDIYLFNMPKLCQFMYKLLQQPEEYQCIEWKDKATKTFKIVKPKELARLWGSTKHKPEMKYEHFARTLRGYISKGLLRKPRQKLHYQFGDQFNI